ncbi:MAG: glycosyltransferase family 4 protein [Oscillospiraceae bacterium]|nr:glycosyltransferase family 4 protein [Oscillospiraceae bacterium]
MNILVYFVEITEYNLARIQEVYSKIEDHAFCYVYGSISSTGHQTGREIPDDVHVLEGSARKKLRQLMEISQAVKPDFAIVNGYAEAVTAGYIRYCRGQGIPYAIESDTQLNIPKSPVKRWIKRIYLQHIFSGNAYGFPGGTRQKKLFQHYGMPDDHIFVMPMTVDTDQFRAISELHTKDEYKEMLGVAGKKVILYAGRFTAVKDLPCLLRAVAKLKQAHDDFVLCLIGKGEQKPQLEKLAVDLGLQENVRFFDYQLMPKLAEYYAAADVFVLPSAFEPWGLVVNEALACRMPVIASDACGCVDDLIIPGENGDVFPTGDAETLAVDIEKWLYFGDRKVTVDVINKWDYQNYRVKLLEALGSIVRKNM